MRRRVCVFRDPWITAEINPRIHRAWVEDGRDGYPPYAAFTRLWKQEHCAQLDPYANGDCPFRRDECALAYLKTAVDAIQHHPDRVPAYFARLARWRGADRADNKPLNRYSSRTDGLQTGRDDLRSGRDSRPVDDLGRLERARLYEPIGTVEELRALEDALGSESLRRPVGRPQRIGDLLGRTNLRSHLAARRGDQGQAATDDPGDPELPVSEPSSLDEMGDEPSSGAADVHQGGE